MYKNRDDLIPELKNFLNNSSDASMLCIGDEVIVFFIHTMASISFIYENLEQPYMREDFNFDDHIKTIGKKIKRSEIEDKLSEGYIIAKYKEEIYIIGGGLIKQGRTPGVPMRESSLDGSLVGFVEDIDANTNLIRQIYRNKILSIKSSTIGTEDNKKISVLYNSKIVDKKVLDYLSNTIGKLNVRSVGDVGDLQQILIKGQLLFPRFLTSERPDRCVMALNDGKIVILLENSPMAIITPCTFHDFMKSADEKYLLPIPALFLLMLRYVAFLVSIAAPCIYVVCVAYNPEIFRVQLALTIAASRKNVPYASFIEVMFMLLAMEFLIEASLRLPKTVGQAATTVGGIVLGQAATDANLVSNVMIILIAAVAIANFVVPNVMMNSAIRVLKYYVLIFSALGGLVGFLCALISIPCYIASIDNLERPYFRPLYINRNLITSFLRKGA